MSLIDQQLGTRLRDACPPPAVQLDRRWLIQMKCLLKVDEFSYRSNKTVQSNLLYDEDMNKTRRNGSNPLPPVTDSSNL